MIAETIDFSEAPGYSVVLVTDEKGKFLAVSCRSEAIPPVSAGSLICSWTVRVIIH